MFKTLVNLALKNAFLRLSRAVLLIVMIGASMGVMLSIEGLYDGMTANMIDKTIRSDSGEISMYAKNYRLKNDIKYTIKDAKQIKKSLEVLESVKSIVSRIKVSGLAQSATKAYPAELIGVDFKDEESFGKFSDFIKKGNLKLGKFGCAIGIDLAKDLNLKLNSKVIFTTQDINKQIQSKLFRVKAIIQTTNINIDKKAIYTSKDKLSSYLGVQKTSATQIAIRSSKENLQDILIKKYKNLDVLNFAQLNPPLQQMQDITDIFNSITFSIVMFVVFIGILGVMYVSILDRVREFGIMLALGYEYKYIRSQVIFEALFLGLAGFIFGSILGYILLLYLNIYGLDLSAFADGMQSFGLSPILYADIKLSYFTTTFFAILLASILSVFLPLRKIKKLNPVDVIKADA